MRLINENHCILLENYHEFCSIGFNYLLVSIYYDNDSIPNKWNAYSDTRRYKTRKSLMVIGYLDECSHWYLFRNALI